MNMVSRTTRGTTARLFACFVVLSFTVGTFGLASTLGLSRAHAAGTDDTRVSSVQQMPWAVVLCRLDGDYPQQRPKAYFQDLLTEAGAGKTGVYDYFLDSSQGRFSIGGSTVFGPFEVPLTASEEYAAAQAEAKKPGVVPARAWRVKNCINAADPYVDFSPFAGVIAVYNSGLESGATSSTMTLDGKAATWPFVILDPGAWNVSFAAHEIGHGMGFGHTRSVKNPNKDYGDPYDIMSFQTGYEFQHPVFVGAAMPKTFDTTYKKDRYDWTQPPTIWQWKYGFAGPSLAAPWRYGKGWLNDIAVKTIDPSACTTFTLNAVNTRPGLVTARIPVSAERSLFVEFRSRSGWDAGLLRDTVLIHELRAGDATPWLVDSPDAEWLDGEVYDDPASNVSIKVESINSQGKTATVSVFARNATTGVTSTASKIVTSVAKKVAGSIAAYFDLARLPAGTAVTVVPPPTCPPKPVKLPQYIPQLEIPPNPDPTRIIVLPKIP
jgi:hypothetical protein